MVSKRLDRKTLTLLCVALSGPLVPLAAGDWYRWRGPEQNGVSRETDLPESWSPSGENLLWSQPYGARSAPIALEGHVYLLNLAGEGETRQERLMCFDADSGKVLWEHRFNVFLTDIPDRRVGWANPVADPETGFVFVHGVQGYLKCIDRDGKVVWERSLTEEFGRISGYGGRVHTPVVDEDRVVISFLNSSWGPQARVLHRYVALDKRTGQVVWWAAPGGPPVDTTYSCPVVAVIDGKRLLIGGNADGAVYALKSRTGETVWRFALSKRGLNSSVVERDGLVYVSHSEENVDKTVMGRVVCIDARGRGDITKTHEKWRVEGLTAGYASPALDGDRLYVADNSANIYCLDAGSGRERWKYNLGTDMEASPLFADGKIYVGSAAPGRFAILKAGDNSCTALDVEDFRTADGRIVEVNGSACAYRGRVYFATAEAFYCIGEKEWKGTTSAVAALPAERTAFPAPPTPAHAQIVPAEVALSPGQSVFFRVRLFDAGGRFLQNAPATWTAKGLLAGSLSQTGRLSVPGDSGFQAGFVEAGVGSLTARARVRVVPQLPFKIDFEAVALGGVPAGWLGASSLKFQVVEQDGSKALKKLGKLPKLMLAKVYLGLPTWGNYTIQADVMGTETRRQMPDVGVIANRYTLSLMGNQQRLRVMSWAIPRFERKMRFRWEPGKWYRMKLRIDPERSQVFVRGKVWPRDDPEPEEWTISAADPRPNLSGSPGLHGYSAGVTDRRVGAGIFWDNIVVTPNDRAE